LAKEWPSFMLILMMSLVSISVDDNSIANGSATAFSTTLYIG
jgi:hypothetical protein